MSCPTTIRLYILYIFIGIRGYCSLGLNWLYAISESDRLSGQNAALPDVEAHKINKNGAQNLNRQLIKNTK